MTGLYSDNTGIFIANSFGVFSPTTSGIEGLFPSSFFYWTDKVSDINAATGDNTFALTTLSGQNVARSPGYHSLARDVLWAHSQPLTSCWNARHSMYTRFLAARLLRKGWRAAATKTTILSARRSIARSTIRPPVKTDSGRGRGE